MARSAKAKPRVDPQAETQNRRRFVEQARAVRGIIYKDWKEPDAGEIWRRSIWELGTKYGITIPAEIPSGTPYSPGDTSDHFLQALQWDVHAAQVIHDTDAERILTLDEDWKTKASTYVSHIRESVSRAEMREALRERIMRRLNDLQAEIDRNRTRMESVTEVLLSLTEAVGKGAKNLGPAVRLLERLAGALSGARTVRLGYESREALPAPESLGMIEGPPELTEESDQGAT